jgi:hypothetical protein
MADQQAIINLVRIADQRWADAIHASDSAPPDAGFAARVRALADAAEQQAAALKRADAAGVGWTPNPNGRGIRISHEVRPGGNRPGPPELWERFDEAFTNLGIAMEGVAISAVARCYGELSDEARAIADALSRAAAASAASTPQQAAG